MINQEHLNEYAHISAPFKEDAAGIDRGLGRHGNAALLPIDAVLDASVVVPRPFTTVWLTAIARLIDGSARFAFSDGATTLAIFDYTLPADQSRNQLLDLTSNNIGIRLLLSPAFFTYFAGTDYAHVDNFGTGLPFETVCTTCALPRVLSLDVDTGSTLPSVTGVARILGGYNTEVVVLSQQGDETVLQINIAPGLGLGLYPCDRSGDTGAKAPPLGLYPDSNGDIQIKGDACYVPVIHKDAGAIEIQGKCSNCCTCENYATVGTAEQLLAARIYAMKTRLLALQASINAAVQTHNNNLSTDVLGATATFNNAGTLQAGLCVGMQNMSTTDPIDVTNIAVAITGVSFTLYPPFYPVTLQHGQGVVESCYLLFESGHSHYGGNVTIYYRYKGEDRTKVVVIIT